jgi:acetylornithine deacetylase/succinyl-diaminopimelate desuccinylase-like protein
MDPFQFIEKDGFYYGRGTADDKAQAAVWIASLIQYKRRFRLFSGGRSQI